MGTWDPTNSFKAYNRAFVDEVGIHSDKGFEVGLELVAKARRLRLPVAEVPTIWLDRLSASHTSSWPSGCRRTCAGTASPSGPSSRWRPSAK